MTKRNLVIEEIFGAAPEVVWRFFAEPEWFAKWWGPDHFTCPFARIDLRAGGTALVSMEAAAMGYPESFSLLRFTRVEPFSRIDYVHSLATPEGEPIDPAALGMPDDFPAEMAHEVTFTALAGGKTHLRVVERDWPVGRMSELSELGMKQSLAKMRAAVAVRSA